MANPLDSVMEWFRTALDGIRVTQRTRFLTQPCLSQEA